MVGFDQNETLKTPDRKSGKLYYHHHPLLWYFTFRQYKAAIKKCILISVHAVIQLWTSLLVGSQQVVSVKMLRFCRPVT